MQAEQSLRRHIEFRYRSEVEVAQCDQGLRVHLLGRRIEAVQRLRIPAASTQHIGELLCTYEPRPKSLVAVGRKLSDLRPSLFAPRPPMDGASAIAMGRHESRLTFVIEHPLLRAFGYAVAQ